MKIGNYSRNRETAKSNIIIENIVKNRYIVQQLDSGCFSCYPVSRRN